MFLEKNSSGLVSQSDEFFLKKHFEIRHLFSLLDHILHSSIILFPKKIYNNTNESFFL